MLLAILILPLFLLSASEAGPLRRPTDDRRVLFSRPGSLPHKWPRQFPQNGTTPTSGEAQPSPANPGGAITMTTSAMTSLFPQPGTSTASTLTTFLDASASTLAAAMPKVAASAATPSPFMSLGALLTPSTGKNNSSATAVHATASSGSPTNLSTSTSAIPESLATAPASPTPASITHSVLFSTSSARSSRRVVTGVPNNGVPTAITTAPASAGTVSPEVYEDNLRSAREYNALFATLTEQSACSPNQAACVGGNVAQCGSDGSFDIASTCGGETMCYGLPLNTTQGVALACVDTATAKSILGSLLPGSSLSSFSGPSSALLSPSTARGSGSSTEKPAETATVTQTVSETTVTIKVTQSPPTQPPAAPTVSTTTHHIPATSMTPPTITSSEEVLRTTSLNTSGFDTFVTKSTPLNVVPVTTPTTAPTLPVANSIDAPKGNNKSDGTSDPTVTVFITVTQTEKDTVTTTVTATATVARSQQRI